MSLLKSIHVSTCKTCVVLIYFFCTLTAQAQGTTMVIHGIVVDKSGIPLKGALVEAAGGVNSVETGDDGTFSLEVSRWLTKVKASAAGMFSKTIKLNKKADQEIVFRLKKNSNFNPKNLKGSMQLHGFVLDKNGNPISGAKIEVKKSEINTLSDADGSFALEIPRSTRWVRIIYPGLKKVTVELHGRTEADLIVKLGKITYWVCSDYNSYD